MAKYTQPNRFLRLTTPLGSDALLLIGFEGSEGISELFKFRLELLAENETEVAFEKLLGQPVTIESTYSGATRYFNGILSQISEVRCDHSFTYYSAEMVPAAWIRAQNIQSRIFQRKTVPEVLQEVLKGLDVSLRLQASYPVHNYCVQYAESDFDFASRLMEEEGIHYYFTHRADGHTLVLADMAAQNPKLNDVNRLVFDSEQSTTSAPDVDERGQPRRTSRPENKERHERAADRNKDDGSAPERSRVLEWRKSQRLCPGRLTMRDFHFQKPDNYLEASQNLMDSLQVGAVRHRLRVSPSDDIERSDYPGGYAHRFDGIGPGGSEQSDEIGKLFEENQRLARIRMEEQASASFVIEGVSDYGHLTPGCRFDLAGHFSGDGEYLFTRVEHSAMLPGYRSGDRREAQYRNRFLCVPAAVPFRPARKTACPKMNGVQTATVVGPADEKIWTDKYGRVKVRFHWDRAADGSGPGQVASMNRSCWVRVSQSWAGEGWGMMTIPRVGQEVIVEFVDGDPDCPIVTGSVYNSKNMPPFELPANRTQSGLKSKSRDGNSASNFSGLAIEDQTGKEHMQLQSERNLTICAEKDQFTNVGDTSWLNVAAMRITTVGGIPGVDISSVPGSSKGSGSGRGSGRGSGTGTGSGKGGGDEKKLKATPQEREEWTDKQIEKEKKKKDQDKELGEEVPFEWKASSLGGIATDLNFTMGLTSKSGISFDNGFAIGSSMKTSLEPLSCLSELGIQFPIPNTFLTGLAIVPSIFGDFGTNVSGSTKIGFGPGFSVSRGMTVKASEDLMTAGSAWRFLAIPYYLLSAGTQLLPLIPRGTYRRIFFPTGIAAVKVFALAWTMAELAKKYAKMIKEATKSAKEALEQTKMNATSQLTVALIDQAKIPAEDIAKSMAKNADPRMDYSSSKRKLASWDDTVGMKVISASALSLQSNPLDDDAMKSTIFVEARGTGGDNSGQVFIKGSGAVKAQGETSFLELSGAAGSGKVKLDAGAGGTISIGLTPRPLIMMAPDPAITIKDSEISIDHGLTNIKVTSNSIVIDGPSGGAVLDAKGIYLDATKGQSINLHAGPSSFSIGPGGITMKGPNVSVSGDGQVEIKSPVVNQ